MLRVLCDPTHMNISHCKFKQLWMLKGTRVDIREEPVIALAQNGVKGKNSGWCRYDTLVLAMGSDYPGSLGPAIALPSLSGRALTC